MSPPSLAASDLECLADLAPALAATYAAVAGDVAMVIGRDGLIAAVALGDIPLGQQAHGWVGLPFVDRFTVESRNKIAQLLVDVERNGMSRRREVNLIGADGREAPVSFAAIRLGEDGPILAVGRDLRTIAALQQQFVEAQQQLERDYWQQREAESRYRQLFQVATDAVMLVDAKTLAVVEANHAASALFGCTEAQLIGEQVTAGLAPGSRAAAHEWLAIARESGQPAEFRARLTRQPERPHALEVDVSAMPFHSADDGAKARLLLVRARASGPRTADSIQRLAEFVGHTPDGVVITDSVGRVMFANPAFLAMCAASHSESQIKGQTLIEALGTTGQWLAPLLDEVHRNGIATSVRIRSARVAGHANDQTVLDLEVSATLLDESVPECIGFTLRPHVVRSEASQPMASGLAGAIESLSGQLGQKPLPELMHEANRLVERHLIEHALIRSGGYAGSAAEWLGVTPKSLALRMQNHGLSSEGPLGEPPGLLN